MKIKNKNLSDKSKKWLKRHLSDKYVKLSKDNSYRSRAAFKLIEIIDKYKVLKSVQSVIDLGAAPGSWSEVLIERIKSPKKIIAIDLLHIDPLPGVEIIQGDDLHQLSSKNTLKRFLHLTSLFRYITKLKW